MTDRFRDLASRSLDGTLSPEEETELVDLLDDPERAREYAEADRVGRELSGLLASPLSDGKMSELVLRDIAGRRDSDRVNLILEKVARRRPRRREAGRPDRAAWTAALASLAAAAMLLALAGVWKSPPAPHPAPSDEAPPVAEERTAPTPEPRAPIAARDPQPLAPAPLVPPAPTPIPQTPATAVSLPEPPVLVPAPPPTAPATATAVAAIGRIERVSGTVLLDRRPARAGDEVLPGLALETGVDGGATLELADGTRLEAGPSVVIRHASGKTFQVDRGRVAAEVKPQPAQDPLILRSATAEARVLGTRFTFTVSRDATRLDVREGKVRLTRLSDRASVDVTADFYSVVAKGADPVARPINLLVNPGFEDGGNGWRWPLPVVTTVSRSGSRAQQIQAGPSFIENAQAVAVAGDSPYAASGWVATRGLDRNRASIWIHWEDAAGKLLKKDVLGWVPGSRNWTRLAAPLRSPPDATRAGFLVVIEGGSGTAWFDDCEFVRAAR